MRHQHPPARSSRIVSLGIVLLAHAALIGAALHSWARVQVRLKTATLEAMSMEMTLVPLAPLTRPSEVPPGPPQIEQMHLEAKLEPLPEPRLELPPDLDSDMYTPPKSQPAADRSGVEQTTSPPAVNVTPDTHYKALQNSAGSSSEAMVTWQSLLLGHLERFKRYPRRAERQRQEGVVYVLFSVDRQGNVRNSRLGKSSGYPALDDETLAVVQRANPVPPPPPEITGDPVEVMVPVSFYLRAG